MSHSTEQQSGAAQSPRPPAAGPWLGAPSAQHMDVKYKLSPEQRQQFEQQVRHRSIHIADGYRLLPAPKPADVMVGLQGWVICRDVFDVVEDFGPLEQVIGVVMDEVCDSEVAAGRITEAHAFRNAPFSQRLALIHAEDEALGTTLAGAVYGSVSTGGRGDELLSLLRHPNLLSLVADLLGPDIIGSSVFRIRAKVPYHERGEVPWHQDSGTSPVTQHCDNVVQRCVSDTTCRCLMFVLHNRVYDGAL